MTAINVFVLTCCALGLLMPFIFIINAERLENFFRKHKLVPSRGSSSQP